MVGADVLAGRHWFQCGHGFVCRSVSCLVPVFFSACESIKRSVNHSPVRILTAESAGCGTVYYLDYIDHWHNGGLQAGQARAEQTCRLQPRGVDQCGPELGEKKVF